MDPLALARSATNLSDGARILSLVYYVEPSCVRRHSVEKGRPRPQLRERQRRRRAGTVVTDLVALWR